LVEAGSIANGDLYNIKSQLAIEQASKVDAENALNLSMLNLKQLMYLPGDTNIEIFAPEIALTEGVFQIQDPYKVYDYALKNRPEIKSAEIQVETAAKDLSIARSGISPSLSLSAGLGSGYSGATSILDGSPIFNGFNPNGNLTASGEEVLSPSFDYSYKTKAFTDQFKDNKNYFVGFSLNVPIFNGLQTHTAINQSEIAVKQAEVELDRSKREMRQTIEQAYADARSASKRYQAVQIQVQALEEAFTYATQRYEAKMTTAFEYNDAKLKLEIAKSDLLNAKYNYVFRVKVLDFYYGKPLTL
jgi:outer membrane protein